MNFTIGGTKITNRAVAASFVSDWLPIAQYRGFSANIAWTGDGTGTFTLEGANDKTDAMATPIPSAESSTEDGSPIMIHLVDAMYQFVRLRYVRASGTLNLSTEVFAK